MTGDGVTGVAVHQGSTPGPLSRAVARAATAVRGLWIAHNSGRFDRALFQWKIAFRYLSNRAVVVTGTEAAGRSTADFTKALGGTGFHYAHLTGAAAGECYAAWDTRVISLAAKPWAHKLTDLTWVRSEEYGGKRAAKVHALVVPLRSATRGSLPSHVLAVVHMPLDNTADRAAAWVDCCRGLVALRAEIKDRWPDAEFIVVGDVNKNLRERDEAGQVRTHLEKPLGAVTSWADGLPRGGGTHGGTVIDYAILRRPILTACQLLKDLPDSDHRAFRFRLRASRPYRR